MKRLLIIYIIVLLNSSWNGVKAQMKQPEYAEPSSSSVSVIVRSKGDSVLIRWAPGNPLLWQIANKYGYRLVRTTVAIDDILLFGEDRKTEIIADSVVPFPLEKIEPLIERDQYTAVVAQAIYGEDFQMETSFESGTVGKLSKAKELEDRYSFALFSADQSPLAAEVHGLWYTDRDVNIHEKYLYEVYPLIPPGIIDYDTAYTVIAVNDTAALPKPYNFTAVWGDKNVELSWNREYMQVYYSSYIIERSEDNGHTFVRTHESPYINLSSSEEEQSENYYRVDSLPQNNVPYQYRIRGISPFGETGPPSDVAIGMGMSKSDFLNPMIVKNEVHNNSIAYLEWEVMEQFAADIEGFEIQKAQKSDGPYFIINKEVLSRQTRNYSDDNPFKTGYYRIGSIDKNNEKHYSFPTMILMPDSIPPAAPVNFSGVADSSGIVLFSWKPNSEDDLAGYRIYRSNYADDGYVKINTEQITVALFSDTLSLRVLTKKVYYKLAAIDNHYNESPLTDALVINRPDTIPPASPTFINYSVNDSAIVLYWNNSPSNDVSDHILYRRKTTEKLWNRINQARDTTGMYVDTNIMSKTIYQYIIVAVDESGLESRPLNTLDIRAMSTQSMPDLKIELKAQADLNGKKIMVSWSIVNAGKMEKFALYRAIDEGPLVLYSTLEGNLKSFEDNHVQMGHQYHYQMQAILAGGVRSLLCPEVVVNF
jgi:uncharacterized protein